MIKEFDWPELSFLKLAKNRLFNGFNQRVFHLFAVAFHQQCIRGVVCQEL